MNIFRRASKPANRTTIPAKQIRSTKATYWEHPSHNETRNQYHRAERHPHKLIIWKHKKDGNQTVGTPVTFWPFQGVMWYFTFNHDGDYCGDAGADPTKLKDFEDIKNWCLKNCQGQWAWSREVNQWFYESGPMESTGWRTHRIHYLLIETGQDAVHFRMRFDYPPNYSVNRTKYEIEEDVRQKNKQAGWRKYSVEYND